jgi:hypothetical protein
MINKNFKFTQIFLLLFLIVSLSSCIKTISDDSKCNDGTLDANEECDGENFRNSCQSFGFTGGFLSCNNCELVFSNCDGYSYECGNEEINTNEECDGSNLNDNTCNDLGYQGGDLSCTEFCKFNKANCWGNCSNPCTTGETKCENNKLYKCTANISFCNEWKLEEDCPLNGKNCTIVDDNFACSDNCDVSCIVGETLCSSDESYLKTCSETIDSSCLYWSVDICENGYCATIENESECFLICESDCAEVDETRCSTDSQNIEICSQVEQNCFQWVTQSTCATDFLCDSVLNNCISQGTGENCQNTFLIPFLPFQVSGIDFNADYNADLNEIPGISCASNGDGGDLVLRYFLNQGEGVIFKKEAGNFMDLKIKSNCVDECLEYGNSTIAFIAPNSGLYYFIAKSLQATEIFEYNLSLKRIPVLNEGDPCYLDYNSGVCDNSTYCAYNNINSVCKPYFEGDNCSEVLIAETGENQGEFQGISDLYSSICFTSGSAEQIWEFTPSISGTYLITFSGFDYGKNIYIRDDCNSATEISCLHTDSTTDATLLITDATDTTPYYIFCEKEHDMYSEFNSYDYSLNIEHLN